MVTLTDLKEALSIDEEDTSQDHYLRSLISRAVFRINSACNRNLDYGERTEYFVGTDSSRLYLGNWPVLEILELQEFNTETGEYEDIITGSGDTIENSVYIYEGGKAGLIRLLKNYSFGGRSIDSSGTAKDSESETDYVIRIRYRSGYRNFQGTGTVSCAASSPAVTGTGTEFVTQFRRGDRLVTGDGEFTVSEIDSDTELTLSVNCESSFADKSYRICSVPPDISEAVLFLAAGSYLTRKYDSYGMDQKTENILSVSYSEIQQVVESSNLTPNVKMRFKEFDYEGVVDAYRRVNV